MTAKSIFSRPFDLILLAYFGSHIPITLLIDIQAIFPKEYFPESAVETVRWFGSAESPFYDPFYREPHGPPTWYRGIIWIELFCQFPFFFYAFYSILVGNKSVRGPAVIYGAHVATTLIPILAEVWFNGVTHGLSLAQQCTLTAVYAPYFIIPFLLMLKFAIWWDEPFALVAAVKPKKN
eukprot:TRINITY_DN21738_c0_g1::TRINITY_DN21738_c0_g1_i1::g.1224::m.1224 TRINITY_DN21738_c0_g1::TRINITY_DN21738_c0_g1_i1::g.1224  ORF type:complete len:179 (+),score=23.10,sp/Q5BJF2/TMM97_HUMAN/38.99/8e-28,DUF2781/PF10914.3/7.8e-33 TRINITY_DN21738_c0_g1_i1:68-604(+)